MSSVNKDELRRLMGEAAALPPEDPLRREVEAKVAAEGEWAEGEWLRILRLDEQIRLELQGPSMPPGLERHLQNIPKDSWRQPWISHRLRWLAVATMVITVLGGGIFWRMTHPPGEREALQTVALLAMSDHLDDRHLAVTTDDPVRFRRALEGEIPFPIVLPALGPDYRLVGGRKCVLGSHPAAYSLWHGVDQEYSLFQFRSNDFGLPMNFKQTVLVPEGPAAGGHPCRVVLWSDEGRGYALVRHL